MTRLSRATLDRVPAEIVAPRGRAPLRTGIVHFGPGAFHRAHQAAYIDALLDRDPTWGIAAVSLRSRGTVDALAAQDGLYTLAIRDAVPAMRIIGAHTAFLGPQDAAETRRLLANPAVRLVTATVTEKGYCLRPDGTLDLAHRDIAHDLASATPISLVGWLVAGLAARRAAGIAPFAAMPCDNLADNGAKIHAALVAFAHVNDPGLADWISAEVRVPSTMVDAITPASDAALRTEVANAIGFDDDAAVQRERFAQWVIAGNGAALPDLAAAGATLTGDVAGWERAKLRILNGMHSTLAYAGLMRGYGTVAEAMRDPDLARFVGELAAADVVPCLSPVAGLDLTAYTAAILDRFRNPAIHHRLDQIAQDGTQKLPYRLGDTIVANRRRGRLPDHAVAALACWIAFLINHARSGVAIVDPAAARLTEIGRLGSPAQVVEALIDEALGIPGELRTDTEFRDSLTQNTEAALANDTGFPYAARKP